MSHCMSFGNMNFVIGMYYLLKKTITLCKNKKTGKTYQI